MEVLKAQVSNNTIQIVQCPKYITSGTIGLKAEFTFDNRWYDLTKMAIFRVGKMAKTVEIKEDTVDVPWEVLEVPYEHLFLGVYGVNADCTLAIPTVWEKICIIAPGADPDADPSVDPTLPIWQDLLFRVEDLEESGGGGDGTGQDGYSPIARVTQTANGAVITIKDKNGTTTATVTNGKDGADGKDGNPGKDGADGHTPQKGVDYWTDADRTQMIADVISALPVYNGEVV